MDDRKKLHISLGALIITSILFIVAITYILMNCGDMGCMLSLMILSLYVGPFLLISLIFTIIYYLRYKDVKVNTKKLARFFGTVFILSLVGFGITWTIFLTDQASSTPMMANPPGQITLWIISTVSLFFTIVFFFQSRKQKVKK